MYQHYILLSFTCCLLGASTYAQVTSDALLYSDMQSTISARALGLGNAMGAVGGDPSSFNMNPAGLGVYRHSEFLISPAVNTNKVRSVFGGERVYANRVGVNLGGLSLVLSQRMDKGNWGYVNFGLGYNRLTSFNQTMSFSGVSRSSRLQSFIGGANGNTPDQLDPFEEQLAYDTYLLDLQNGSSTNYVAALTDSNLVRKSQLVRQGGGINELAISLASVYKNKLYIGGTFGIDILNYKENKTYEELDTTGTIDFKQMKYDEVRTDKGLGINLKLGMLYRLNYRNRIGLSIHTPTYFSLTEKYNTTMYGKVLYQDSLQVNTFNSPQALYKQSFSTPWVFTGSWMYVFGVYKQEEQERVFEPKGFFTMDLEYVNYKWAKFGILANDTTANISTQQYFNNLNNSIDNTYKGVLRLRAGLEFVADIFRFRLGYQLQTSPYQAKVAGVYDLRHVGSIGIGIRKQAFFFDVAYSLALKNFEYLPYSPSSDANFQQVISNAKTGNFMMTVGFRF